MAVVLTWMRWSFLEWLGMGTGWEGWTVRVRVEGPKMKGLVARGGFGMGDVMDDMRES